MLHRNIRPFLLHEPYEFGYSKKCCDLIIIKPQHSFYEMEAPPRFELGRKGFADLCLTTWLWRRINKRRKKRLLSMKWSGRRDSNSRRSPWQGDALPLSHSRVLSVKTDNVVPSGGIEPPTQGFSVPCSTD